MMNAGSTLSFLLSKVLDSTFTIEESLSYCYKGVIGVRCLHITYSISDACPQRSSLTLTCIKDLFKASHSWLQLCGQASHNVVSKYINVKIKELYSCELSLQPEEETEQCKYLP